MGRQSNWDPDALPTIWEVSAELWALLAPVLAERDPPKRPGRPRISARAALDEPLRV